jgi:hypothetical protein
MLTRSSHVAAAIALASMLASCTTYAPDDPIPPTHELRAIQGTSWMVRRVTFRRAGEEYSASGARLSAGFDLDGIDSTRPDVAGNCEEYSTDYASELDPELVGVDNAGGGLISVGEDLAGGTFADALDEAVKEGRLRWALRVGELADDDSRIELEVFAVDAGESVTFDGEGFPAAGQRLRARRIASTSALVRRSVAWGRADSMELTADGEVMLLPFDDFRLGAVGIAAQPEATRLYANIGGSFSVDALADVAVRDLSPDDAVSARFAFDAVADLVPSAADPQVCERISVGFGLDAVAVELIVE